MKRLFSLMVVTIVCVLALTVVAGATDNIYYLNDEGLIDISYELGADKTGSMYGLVVIEAEAVPASFSLEADDIRHIDQANAAGEVVSFDGFTPKDLETTTNEYLVYIGGDGINGATRLGKIMLTEAPELFDIVFVDEADQTIDTIQVYEGSLLNEADFPAVPTKEGYEGTWDVDLTVPVTEAMTISPKYTVIPVEEIALSKTELTLGFNKEATLTVNVTPATATIYDVEWASDNEDVATVENGVVTAKEEAGEAKITATIAGTDINAECIVTVSEVTVVCGDVNNDGGVNRLDGTFLARHLAKWKVYDGVDYSTLPSEANSDINADGGVNRLDGTALARYLAKWKLYEGVDYSVLPVVEVDAQ